MKNSEILPHIIRLLDDDNAFVESAVGKELAEFGPWLDAELSQLDKPLTDFQKSRVQQLLQQHNDAELKAHWQSALKVEPDKEKLEKGLSVIADFQNGMNAARTVKDVLDQLAEEFIATRAICDVFELANFLFVEKGLKGAEKYYYHPQNSNLVSVIDRGEGIPISLVCVYMLVGKRLELEIEGCNFPGHFLARIKGSEGYILVDCFSRGQLLHEKVIAKADVQYSELTREIIHQPATAGEILKRVLRNLMEAYRRDENARLNELMYNLLQETY